MNGVIAVLDLYNPVSVHRAPLNDVDYHNTTHPAQLLLVGEQSYRSWRELLLSPGTSMRTDNIGFRAARTLNCE